MKDNKIFSQEKVIEILRKQFPYLVSEYGIKKIGLFGSYARGTQSEDSDIDILVIFTRPIGLKFIQLAEDLERLLGKKVDILTSEGIKGIRINKVARDIEGSIVYV